MALIQVLICTFEDQPPVYAVPAQPVAQPMPMQSPAGATMPNVPYPLQQQSSYATPYPPYPGAMPMPPAISQMPGLPNQTTSDTLTPHIRASLLSAGSEKLTRRLEDIYFSTQIEIKVGFLHGIQYN